MNNPRARRPLTPIFTGLFFAIATTMTIAAGMSLLLPGSILDAMWRIKPDEHRQLLQVALPASMGFFVLAVVMAAASTGSFLRRRWAWRLAIVIFIVNGLGDGVRILSGAPMEGVFGVAVVALILFWLTRRRVRALFDR